MANLVMVTGSLGKMGDNEEILMAEMEMVIKEHHLEEKVCIVRHLEYKTEGGEIYRIVYENRGSLSTPPSMSPSGSPSSKRRPPACRWWRPTTAGRWRFSTTANAASLSNPATPRPSPTAARRSSPTVQSGMNFPKTVSPEPENSTPGNPRPDVNWLFSKGHRRLGSELIFFTLDLGQVPAAAAMLW